jgi:2-polyprenyl-3-methyl-5-hydroxy-6-metoxy-1,4-benzoquinol methylase
MTERAENCICCGSAKREQIAPNRYFEGTDVVRCAECSLVYPYPRPGAGQVDEFYRKSYYSFGSVLGPLLRSLKLYYSGLRARHQHRWITSVLKLPPGARVLEIGCGYGRLLELFHSEGCAVEGVEPSEDCALFTSRKFAESGQVIFHGTLEQYDPGDRRFDLIVSSHVFEHFVAPEEIIERLKDMLVPGGCLFFELPNQESEHYLETGYSQVPDFYFFNAGNFDSFIRARGLETMQTGHIEFSSLLRRYDMLGHLVNYTWWAVLDLFGRSCFREAAADSIWMRALVRKP